MAPTQELLELLLLLWLPPLPLLLLVRPSDLAFLARGSVELAAVVAALDTVVHTTALVADSHHSCRKTERGQATGRLPVVCT
mmetsp:Transcript_49566/g.98411  ORF Transcript_49566/g.98411 Transcript_49566/m.98411 type:complete len:82 (+) Transcript_49566:482-727(+)